MTRRRLDRSLPYTHSTSRIGLKAAIRSSEMGDEFPLKIAVDRAWTVPWPRTMMLKRATIVVARLSGT
jgi:hypothetical protein